MKQKIILFALLIGLGLGVKGQTWLTVGNTLQRTTDGTGFKYRFSLGSPGFYNLSDSIRNGGKTYTAGYGMSLVGQQFRVDTAKIATNYSIDSRAKANRIYQANSNSNFITQSSGTLVYFDNLNFPDGAKKIARFTPSSSGSMQQLAMTASSKINGAKKSVLGFWVNRSDLGISGINVNISHLTQYLTFADTTQLGINKSDLSSVGFTTSNSKIIFKVFKVSGDWTYVTVTINATPSLTFEYLGVNIFINGAIAGNKYDFTNFTLINDDVTLYPNYQYPEQYNADRSTFAGKTIIWCGDSIFAENKSQQVAIGELGLSSVNIAFAGSTITPGFGADPTGGVSTLELVPNITAQHADIIYINGGTNDYGYGVPLGTMADVWNPAIPTFYGAYKKMIQDLVTNNPKALVMVSTPIYGNLYDGDLVTIYKAREKYVDAIIQICNLYGVPVLDKFRSSPVSMFNYLTTLRDKIHPTDPTYYLLGKMDSEFILNHNGVVKSFNGLQETTDINNVTNKSITTPLLIANSSSYPEIRLTSPSKSYGIYNHTGNNSLRITEAGIGDHFILVPGGNIGIGGIEAPSEKIDVNGLGRFRGLSGAGDRPVFVDANGTLKIGTIDLGTGWAVYSDNVYTSASPYTITSSSTATLPNNAAAILNSQIPLGVTSLYNSSTLKITPENNGDYYIATIRFKAKTTAPTAGYFDFGIDIGGALGMQFKETKIFAKGAGIEHNFSMVVPMFTAATFLANGGQVKITAGNGDMTIYEISYQIDRTHKAR